MRVRTYVRVHTSFKSDKCVYLRGAAATKQCKCTEFDRPCTRLRPRINDRCYLRGWPDVKLIICHTRDTYACTVYTAVCVSRSSEFVFRNIAKWIFSQEGRVARTNSFTFTSFEYLLFLFRLVLSCWLLWSSWNWKVRKFDSDAKCYVSFGVNCNFVESGNTSYNVRLIYKYCRNLCFRFRIWSTLKFQKTFWHFTKDIETNLN